MPNSHAEITRQIAADSERLAESTVRAFLFALGLPGTARIERRISAVVPVGNTLPGTTNGLVTIYTNQGLRLTDGSSFTVTLYNFDPTTREETRISMPRTSDPRITEVSVAENEGDFIYVWSVGINDMADVMGGLFDERTR